MREHPKNPLRFSGTPLAPTKSQSAFARALTISPANLVCKHRLTGADQYALNQLSSSRDQ